MLRVFLYQEKKTINQNEQPQLTAIVIVQQDIVQPSHKEAENKGNVFQVAGIQGSESEISKPAYSHIQVANVAVP